MKRIIYEGYCEHLRPCDDTHPSAYIGLADDLDNPAPEALGLRQFVVRLHVDGWYDVWVRKITVVAIKAVLAHLNGVTPDDIEFVRHH